MAFFFFSATIVSSTRLDKFATSSSTQSLQQTESVELEDVEENF